MNPDDKVDTITISLDDVKTVDFDWNDSTMISGLTAQSIDTITLTGSSMTTINVPYISTISNGINTVSVSGYDDFGPTRREHIDLIERVEKLEKLMAEEAEIRANHPAVKNAYDEYRMLLVLAKQHTPNILTDE